MGRETQYLDPPTEDSIAEHPGYEYLAPYTVNVYVAPESPELQEAMDEVIHEMYASGEMTELIEEYGGDPKWLERQIAAGNPVTPRRRRRLKAARAMIEADLGDLQKSGALA